MSITAARGFAAAGVRCGIRRSAADLALVRSLPPATGAAMFTTNRVQAAPVKVSREHLELADRILGVDLAAAEPVEDLGPRRQGIGLHELEAAGDSVEAGLDGRVADAEDAFHLFDRAV